MSDPEAGPCGPDAAAPDPDVRPAGPDAGRPRTPRLTLLYREGCHLCEEMEALLGELLEPGAVEIERLDVDEHPALLAEHHVRVPVLALDGVELCHHFLDLEAVRAALAGYNRPAGPSRPRQPEPSTVPPSTPPGAPSSSR